LQRAKGGVCAWFALAEAVISCFLATKPTQTGRNMSTLLRKATQVEKADVPRRFVFLLLDKFTMMSFAGALEPLRVANRASGVALYSWALAGEGGLEVRCSNGAAFKLDMGLDEIEREDVVLVRRA
jgi:hypothetical protein